MIAHVYILQYNVKHIVLFPEVWTDNKQYMLTICLDLSHLYKKKKPLHLWVQLTKLIDCANNNIIILDSINFFFNYKSQI